MGIYLIPKPDDMTGRCPTCLADVEALAQAVKVGAINFCTDPAHGSTEPQPDRVPERDVATHASS